MGLQFSRIWERMFVYPNPNEKRSVNFEEEISFRTGHQFSRIWERMFGKKEMRILMIGLNYGGKVSKKKLEWDLLCLRFGGIRCFHLIAFSSIIQTTILYRLKLGVIIETTPSIG